MNTTSHNTIDETALHTLVGSILKDLGGAFSIPLVQIGESLGLYWTLHTDGALTAEELATKAKCHPRYIREWLSAQAASSYVTYDPATEQFSLSPEQAFVLANPDSPFYLAPAFGTAASFTENMPKVRDAFRTGQGVAWGDQSQCLSCSVAPFFRPGYHNHLVSSWLPARKGVVGKLKAGAEVADVGCGHGISTLIMAQAFPKSKFHGFDFHEKSIEEARHHQQQHGAANLDFHIQEARDLPGQYDFITMFDCLHDMGDPVGALKTIRQALKPGGTVMIVEPMAGDSLKDNLNPVGRIYYSASTMVCVPTSLAQETGRALGAQAGEKRLREVIVNEAGFTSLRRAIETPFNMILERTA